MLSLDIRVGFLSHFLKILCSNVTFSDKPLLTILYKIPTLVYLLPITTYAL